MRQRVFFKNRGKGAFAAKRKKRNPGNLRRAREKTTGWSKMQRCVLGLLAAFALLCWLSGGEEDGSFWPLDLVAPKGNKGESGEMIQVLHVADGNKIKHMPIEEYIAGVVSAEMPIGYELEALKAQAVAARTYTYDKMLGNGCNRSEAVICTSSGHCQAFCDEQGRRKKWGSSFEKNEAKLQKAIRETKGQVLEYDGAPIVALFHSTSGGHTEDVENGYKRALPYLRGVDSPGEESAPRYQRTTTVSNKEFVEKIKQENEKAELSEKNLKDQIKNIERTNAGRVQSVEIGKIKFTGKQIRMIFKLDSTFFTFDFEDNQVKITTKGYGHGVGMSQVGANAMAKEGKSYEEILKHYYTGVTLAQMEKP